MLCAGVASAGPIPFEEEDTIEVIREKIVLNGYAFEVDTNWVFNLPRAERKVLHNRRTSEPSNYRMAAPEDAGPLEEVLKEKKALPTSFDWRNVGGRAYIGAVRDQGACGSCYAFGACAAAESTYNYAMGLYNGNAVDFSESFIIWCLATLPDYSEHFSGCDGADYDYAELTAMTREGISYESAFPYTVSASCGTHWNDPRVVFDSWHRIPCGDIEAIKTAIMTYGAVDVAVYVGSAFSAYSSGIYEDTRTACNGTPCYYTAANHAVALVGWNDADGGYWILRNSWGTGWGESGYMRIRYTSAVVSCEACYFYLERGPTITTLAASNLGDNTARLNGAVNPNNQYTQYYFQYGLTTAYGNNTLTQSAGSGSAEVNVQTNLTGLEPRTLYHFRIVGVSGGRSIPGTDRTFTTTGTPVPPDVVSLPATGVSHEYATLNATVNPRGAATTAWFEYGTNAAYGMATPKTSVGSASTAVSVNRAITDLLSETTYHFRAAASNAAGVTYGDDRTFLTAAVPVTFLEEDFEHGGAMPSGWTEEYVRPCVNWLFRNGGVQYPATAHSGSYNAYAYYAGWNGRSTRLITPPIDFGTNRYAKLTFWLFNQNWLGDQDVLRVLTRKSAMEEWALAGTWDQNLAAWTRQSVYLTNLSTTCFVAFEGLLNYGYGVAVDDVNIATCVPPPAPTPTPPAARAVRNDFDGDARSDIGCYYPPSGDWYFYFSSSGFARRVLGQANTVPVTDDFDGDGLCDFGTYYAPYGWWDLQCSSDGLRQNDFGFAGTIPVSGDFDGDRYADYGCYYPPTGAWYLYRSTGGFSLNYFGYAGTLPVVGDFDGDGIDDYGCYDPPNGAWYIYKSRDGFWENRFGYAGTTPITGDFDGDGLCDFGCYYPPTGSWYLFKSRDGFWVNRFGFGGTTPIVGDYDGDGIDDFGCYYPPTGGWYMYKSREGFWVNYFGYEGTIPIR